VDVLRIAQSTSSRIIKVVLTLHEISVRSTPKKVRERSAHVRNVRGESPEGDLSQKVTWSTPHMTNLSVLVLVLLLLLLLL
jgi:hypothetical protein